MVRMVEPELARASSALWASAACLSAKRWLTLMRTFPEATMLGFLNFLLFVTEDRQFHKFIIITILLLFQHDSVIH